MKDMLIYYGWLSSFNSAENGWSNESVAVDMAKYSLVVCGAGIEASSHGDYSNSEVIIPRIKELNSNCRVHGYVTSDQTLADFKTKVKDWKTLGADSIFLDESGYDFSVSRQDLNDRLSYCHSQGMKCMVNSWDIDDVLSSAVDATHNPDGLESAMAKDDYYLLESFSYGPYGPASALEYEDETEWKARGDKMVTYKGKCLMAGLCQLDDGDSSGQDKFDFMYTSALMYQLDAFGSSDKLHGSSSAKTKYWDRPVYNTSDVQKNGSEYYVYINGGRLKLDYSSGSEASAIDLY